MRQPTYYNAVMHSFMNALLIGCNPEGRKQQFKREFPNISNNRVDVIFDYYNATKTARCCNLKDTIKNGE
jgi:hypothetical protein